MTIQYNSGIHNIQDKDRLSKLIFLSYHIALYKTISESLGFNNREISVDEIFDFIQDLKEDKNIRVPTVERIEISLCFSILESMGICHSR
jgi:hypothetical protein